MCEDMKAGIPVPGFLGMERAGYSNINDKYSNNIKKNIFLYKDFVDTPRIYSLQPSMGWAHINKDF